MDHPKQASFCSSLHNCPMEFGLCQDLIGLVGGPGKHKMTVLSIVCFRFVHKWKIMLYCIIKECVYASLSLTLILTLSVSFSIFIRLSVSLSLSLTAHLSP